MVFRHSARIALLKSPTCAYDDYVVPSLHYHLETRHYKSLTLLSSVDRLKRLRDTLPHPQATNLRLICEPDYPLTYFTGFWQECLMYASGPALVNASGLSSYLSWIYTLSAPAEFPKF